MRRRASDGVQTSEHGDLVDALGHAFQRLELFMRRAMGLPSITVLARHFDGLQSQIHGFHRDVAVELPDGIRTPRQQPLDLAVDPQDAGAVSLNANSAMM